MGIPLATTKVTITGKRPQSAVDPDAEGYDPPTNDTPWVLATGVRATITLPSNTRLDFNADNVDYYQMRCDPVSTDVSRYDTVRDEVTGIVYNVEYAQHSHPLAFGLDHITARLTLTKGLQSGGDRFAA